MSGDPPAAVNVNVNVSARPLVFSFVRDPVMHVQADATCVYGKASGDMHMRSYMNHDTGTGVLLIACLLVLVKISRKQEARA